MRLTIFLLFIFFSLPLLAQKQRARLPAQLAEASGMHIATPDSLWWHNDSGGRSSLYLTNGQGQLLAEVPVPHAVNNDWEDLSTDPQGRLYIGDFGNNANRRRDLRIYIFDPAASSTDSILFSYPDQTAFPPPPHQAAYDMEAFFWWNDTLHLFSKNRLVTGNYLTRHYTLPAAPGQYVATLVDSLLLPHRVATAAAIRPDGSQVAILSYLYRRILGFIPVTRTTVFLWEDYPGSRFLQGRSRAVRVRKCLFPTQYEAIDYRPDGALLIASESVPFRKAHFRTLKSKKISASELRP